MARHEMYEDVPQEPPTRGVSCLYCASEILAAPPCACPGCGRAVDLAPDEMTVGMLRARVRNNGFALRLVAEVRTKTRGLSVDLSFPDDATLGEVAKAAAAAGLSLELAATPLPELEPEQKGARKPRTRRPR